MNKKQEILDASFSLLNEIGDVAQLNLRKIARRAGCAHTNVYNYFTNFEALKWAMLEEALKQLDIYMFGQLNTIPPALETIGRYIDFALDNPALYKLIWITDLIPEAAPPDTSFLYSIPAKLTDSMPKETADILHSYIHGKLLNLIFSRFPQSDMSQQKKEMLKISRNLLNQ